MTIWRSSHQSENIAREGFPTALLFSQWFTRIVSLWVCRYSVDNNIRTQQKQVAYWKYIIFISKDLYPVHQWRCRSIYQVEHREWKEKLKCSEQAAEFPPGAEDNHNFVFHTKERLQGDSTEWELRLLAASSRVDSSSSSLWLHSHWWSSSHR